MPVSFDNKFVQLSLEKSLRDLPALPDVVAKVLAATENPDTSAQTIEKLISTDQALASKVLRVVNSAYYGLSGQVTSLSQAIMILGMPQVRNLVLSVSAISTMKPKTTRQQEVLKLFWVHAFGTAAATQLIAKQKRMNLKDSEAMFLGGLLHDIGKLFLYCMFTQTYDQVLKFALEKQVFVRDAEMKLLGNTHGPIGGTMARTWKLPETLVNVIERHEGPFTQDDDPMLFVVHAGDTFTKHLYYPTEQMLIPPLDPVAEAWLDLTAIELDELTQEVLRKIEEASNLFGLLAA